MFKSRYRYDLNALEYVEHKPTRPERLHKAGFLVAFSFVLALVVYFGPVGKGLVNWWLENESHTLVSHIEKQQKALTQLEVNLEQIHKNEQNFYRSLLDLPAAEPTQWKGGTGGRIQQATSPSGRLVQQMNQSLEQMRRRLKLQRENHTQLIATAQQKSEALSRLPVLVPVRGQYISGFGYRVSPIHGHSHFHAGIDFAAPMGTPIYAANEGTIITAGWPESGYGLQVEIAHGNGFVTKYAHMSKIDVHEGQKVKRGQVIGRVGSTGQSIGAHLHYEVIRDGNKVNPAPYLLLNN